MLMGLNLDLTNKLIKTTQCQGTTISLLWLTARKIIWPTMEQCNICTNASTENKTYQHCVLLTHGHLCHHRLFSSHTTLALIDWVGPLSQLDTKTKKLLGLRVLLLGVVTFGCSMARTLLGWGLLNRTSSIWGDSHSAIWSNRALSA